MDKKTKTLVRFLSTLIFFSFLTLFSQQSNYKLDRFTINNGLSNNSINCIIQTKDGYLWIATKDGLNRYDGQTFKIFKTNSSDKTSLPENYIMYLYEDKKNNLWVGTWGLGICKYDPFHESFIRVDKTTNDDFVQSIEEDEEGNIWYGTTHNGLKKYNPQTSIITSFNSKSVGNLFLPADNITSLYFENRNSLRLATWDSGIIKIEPERGMISQIIHDDSKTYSLANNKVWFIDKADSNSLFVSTNTGLDLFQPNTNLFIHSPNIPANYKLLFRTAFRQTLVDHSGKLWIGSYDYQGLFVLSHDDSFNPSFIHLVNEDDDPFSLICQRIRWLYEDKQNNIWIGTEDGLNKLPKTKAFQQYKYMPSRKNTLGGRVTSSIFEGRHNTLWVGFGGDGFDRIDLKTNQITHFKQHSEIAGSLNTNDVISLMGDRNGIIWIATSNGGLNKYNPYTNSFKHFMNDPSNPNSIKSNWVQQIIETSDNLFLVGTNDGLQVFDRSTELFRSFSSSIGSEGAKIPELISVNSLYEDNQKNIWIGTWLDGLFCYDYVTKKISHYFPDFKPNSISGNKISSIMQDSHGYIWIGTFSNGLNKLDKRNGKFTYYNISNGLPNDCVFGILEDENNFIWISTMKGLAKLNPSTSTFRVYDVDDGLVNNQFNWHAYFKNSQGKMYFGGISGFVSFFPGSIKIEEQTPIVALTSFKVFDKEATLQRSLSTIQDITLEHNQNFFSLNFTALDLTPMYKHQFSYMLEGVDPQWVHSGSRTTAFYTDIKNGSYRFLVKASNADGKWGTPTSLRIKILPAWWQTWWFRTISIGLIISMFFAGYRYRVNQLLKIEKIRFSIASDLHDEIGSNLSSISVDSQSLMSSTTLNRSEKELAIDISKTARETVEAMRDIIWFINPKNDLNEDIIFKMKQTAAKHLSNMEWSFEATEGVRIDWFNLDIRRNIFLLYKEALTNVVHHSKAKKCNIVISGNQKNFSLSIHDDGIGFELMEFKSTNGIRSMNARAQKMNGKLDIISSPNNGTKVELVI